jgi:hypothetical protein
MSNLINIAALTAQLVKQINEYPDNVGYFKEVTRAEYANVDPALTPWCGVYRVSVGYTPKVLGQHSMNWQSLLTMRLIVQAHAGTGPESEDALEEAVHKVMTAVLSDLSINSLVDKLNSVAIEYSYDETESKTLDFQWAFITLIYETRSGT